ncbi:hypothetical protein Dsin_001803 [Dipteronia sinensis]|uniref:Uncharacterized protein n=1 Tax=Dipteronia sinensis TaxID=43782 RepID=A0AAE0B4Y9_9ROSI|nr:hypothetical protein Dsin_001803 [Dipteronia sinensis]
MQKFTDNNIATSTFRRQNGHFVSSQEDSPTPESPTVSPGLSSFSLNITTDDVGGNSSQWPVGGEKAKLKRRAEEESSNFFLAWCKKDKTNS